jgi:hypothetical protein
MKKTDDIIIEDFAYFRNGISSGRLNPVRVGKLLFVFPLVSLLFVYVGEQFAIYNVYDCFFDQWKLLIDFQWILLEISGALSLLFLSKRLSIMFQKVQMLVLIFNALYFAFDMAFVSFMTAKSENPSFPLMLVLSLLKKGAFRIGGSGLLGSNIVKASQVFHQLQW